MSNVGIIPKSSYRQTHSRRTAQPDHQNTATEQRRFLEMFSRPTCSFRINFVPRVFVQLAVAVWPTLQCSLLVAFLWSFFMFTASRPYGKNELRLYRASKDVCASLCAENYHKCADTIGTVPVPRASHFQSQNISIYFQIKYTEAILSNCTRKLLWFEII